jgi:hypothetical protein
MHFKFSTRPLYAEGNNIGNFIFYDKSVYEVVPMVLTVRGLNGTTENKVVCLAPNNVVNGSRIPEESLATSLNSTAALGAAVAVAGLVSILSIAL